MPTVIDHDFYQLMRAGRMNGSFRALAGNS
jgi:hypothetical protein